MRAITAETGGEAGAIRKHFAARQDLLMDLSSLHIPTLLAARRAEKQPDASASEALKAFVRSRIRYHPDRSPEDFISCMEPRNLDDDAFGTIEALRRQDQHIPRGVLEKGIRDGSFAIGDPHRPAQRHDHLVSA